MWACALSSVSVLQQKKSCGKHLNKVEKNNRKGWSRLPCIGSVVSTRGWEWVSAPSAINFKVTFAASRRPVSTTFKVTSIGVVLPGTATSGATTLRCLQNNKHNSCSKTNTFYFSFNWYGVVIRTLFLSYYVIYPN